MNGPAAIVTDIEGTTTPIAFVHRTLFPYAKARLAEFLAREGGNPQVAGLLAETRALAPDAEPLDALLGWMEQDAKMTPLKALQGMIWREGFETGALRGEIYPDVPPVLRSWHQSGIALHVYSSGSEAAQRLLFGYSTAGNLAELFTRFFDTRLGEKRAAASYRGLASRIGQRPHRVLFLSDVEAELDAARLAGLHTCQLVRAEDETMPSSRHPHARDFTQVAMSVIRTAAGHCEPMGGGAIPEPQGSLS